MTTIKPIKRIILSFLIITTILSTTGGFAYLKFIEGSIKSPTDKPGSLKEVIGDRPVNFLLMGQDITDNNKKDRFEKPKYSRSDTMIVIHLDPKRNKAAMISIPRDLKVEIEDRGTYKINAAIAIKDGGPNLAIRLVSELLNWDIHHYATIKFDGFIKVIDSMGGLPITIDKAINNNSRLYSMHIPAGHQVLDGTTALNYVRFRHDADGSDTGRIKRQQNFAKALISKMTSWSTIPKLPGLIKIFAEHSETDLSVTEMISLARAMQAVGQNNVQMVTIPGDYNNWQNGEDNGTAYYIGDKYRTKAMLSAIEEGLPVNANFEETTVIIRNGSGIEGEAAKLKPEIAGLGFQVLKVETADDLNNGDAVVYYQKDDKKQAAEAIAQLIHTKRVKKGSSTMFPSKYTDVIVVTGKSN